MGLLNLFKKRSEPKILTIQRKDSKITKHFFDLILGIEKNLEDLKKALSEDKLASKYARLAELENSFLRLKSKVETLEYDVRRILSIEAQNRGYVIFNDEDYLKDKLENINLMNQTLDELIELLNQKPSSDDLRREVFNYINGKVNLIVDSVNKIVADDKHLENIYSKLGDL